MEIVQIASGDNHALFLEGKGNQLISENGNVHACGNNTEKQLSKNEIVQCFKPILIYRSIEKLVKGISCGSSFSSLIFDGKVYSFGSNENAELGINKKEISHSFEFELCDKVKNVVKLASKKNHSAALTSLGEVFTWGSRKEVNQINLNSLNIHGTVVDLFCTNGSSILLVKK
jgi:alpha-tubulin suppressor-like RCC1 family protein